MNTSTSSKEEEPGVLYLTNPDVLMHGLDDFKTVAQETRGNRNMIPTENATTAKKSNETV